MNCTRHDLNATMSKVVEHNGVVYIAGTTAPDAMRSLHMAMAMAAGAAAAEVPTVG